LERNFCFPTASGTSSSEPFSFASGGVFPCITASFTPLGFVYETFFGIKFLFTGGENEFRTAFFAGESFVFVHDCLPRLKKIVLP
jgi:hypothetical protein